MTDAPPITDPADGVDPDSADFALEKTIATMEQSQLCFHPVHHHSFSPVTFLISGSMRKCAGCKQRLKAVLGSSTNVDNQVVRCVSCGFYAHRSCSMGSSSSRPEDFMLMWNTKCTVNSTIIEQNEKEITVGEENEVMTTEEPETLEDSVILKNDDSDLCTPRLQPESDAPIDENAGEPTALPRTFLQFLSPARLLAEATVDDVQEPLSASSDDDEEDEEILLWTPEGPPRHWASEQSLMGIRRCSDDNNVSSITFDTISGALRDDDDDEPENPLHVASSTFDTVSRALQENIIAHFIRRPFIEKVISQDQEESVDVDGKQEPPKEESELTQASPERRIERTSMADSKVSPVDVKALLTEVEPTSPRRKTCSSSTVSMASGTLEVAKTVTAMRSKLGLASVAGGIAGGVAGLCVAGPAGAVIGAKCGQTAGLLGVLLEGSMTVGVFVAGVAAGGLTAHHLQQQQEKRVLTIGEDGVKRKLLLVRPNVWIDPVWEQICEKARNNHPSNRRTFGLLPMSQGKQAVLSKNERYQRDSDIVETDESEIPTADKVLLLVSRSLNDKQSLPGHVYKSLIQDYRERCLEREKAWIEPCEGEKTEQVENSDTKEDESNDEMEPLVDNQEDLQETANRLRGRRHDTHAVIKHVTATLLEVRPGFAASPAMTEMSATAVEGLVFGELYDSVFEEIVDETSERDKALMDKIHDFDEAHGSPSNKNSCSNRTMISQPAVDALLMLPEAHSAVDKLRYCVHFLELVSVHFSLMSKKGSALSADSLLKMVCQHIIAAKVPSLNAEIVFLEEFARDEQLLRGKEGYALVTLQASLHFLNSSTNFVRDIFGDEEE